MFATFSVGPMRIAALLVVAVVAATVRPSAAQSTEEPDPTGGLRSRGMVPGVKNSGASRDELVRQWDLDGNGTIDESVASVARARMRRSRMQLELDGGLDPVTGKPRVLADGEATDEDRPANPDTQLNMPPEPRPAIDEYSTFVGIVAIRISHRRSPRRCSWGTAGLRIDGAAAHAQRGHSPPRNESADGISRRRSTGRTAALDAIAAHPASDDASSPDAATAAGDRRRHRRLLTPTSCTTHPAHRSSSARRCDTCRAPESRGTWRLKCRPWASRVRC